MNTILKTSLTILLLIVSFSANASRYFDVEVNSDGVLEIQIQGKETNDKLTFVDAKGEILFVDTNIAQPYLKKVSLINLPKGNYTLSLENSNLISYKSIHKTNTGIKIEDAGVVFKPKFKVVNSNSRKVKVSFTNPTMEFTQMKIYDAEGNLMMDMKEKDLVFEKTLDFTKVPSGEYSIAINNRGRSYYENLNIQ